MRRGGEEKKHLRGLLFFHTAVGSLGATPSINIFAKETCFQGASLPNSGCTMRWVVGLRLVGPGAGSAQVFSSVMKCKSSKSHDQRGCTTVGIKILKAALALNQNNGA